MRVPMGVLLLPEKALHTGPNSCNNCTRTAMMAFSHSSHTSPPPTNTQALADQICFAMHLRLCKRCCVKWVGSMHSEQKGSVIPVPPMTYSYVSFSNTIYF